MRKISLLLFSLFLFQSSFGQSGYEFLKKVNINRNTKLDPFFKGVSASVLPVTLLTPSSMFAWSYYKNDKNLREKAITCTAGILVSGGISLGLKLTVQRDRPYVTHPDIEALVHSGPYSFPSAHTSNAFATATSLSLLFPKWYVVVPAYTWAGLAGYSRMHLGVHYPGDVIAGAFIGAGSAVLCYYGNHWIRGHFAKR